MVSYFISALVRSICVSWQLRAVHSMAAVGDADSEQKLQDAAERVLLEKRSCLRALGARDERAQVERAAAVADGDDLRDERDALAKRLQLSERQVARLMQRAVRSGAAYVRGGRCSLAL